MPEQKPIPVIPILIGLVIIGAILRFYHLDFNSLWLDEASTSFLSQPGIIQIWENTVGGEFNPPLFYWLEHFVIQIFGNSEVTLRALPALFGVAAIPIFYLVGKEFRDETTGIIMAVACTVSPFLIMYSQEARTYTLLLLLIAGATYFFVRAIRTGKIGNWIMFAVLGAVAFWTHFYALVIIAVLFSYTIFLIYEKRERVRQVLGAGIVFFVISLPLFIQLVHLYAIRTATPPAFGMKGWKLISETFIQLSGFSDMILIAFISLFIVGVGGTLYKNKIKGIFLVWVIILTALFSIVASSIIPMMPRYLIFLSVFFYLGIAASYEPIQRITKIHTNYIAILFTILFVTASVPFLSGYYTHQTKEDWRLVARDLEQLTENGDIIIAVPQYLDLPLTYYYSPAKDGTIIEGYNTIKGLNESNGDWYVVTGDIMASDPSGEALRWIQANTQPVKQYPGVYILKGVRNV